tara:strand:+ start:762 stop:1499 length:738 start_codon:yes stop_codon:yes gene_type:complete
MAQEDIIIGAANQGNGDTLFAAFTKVQSNFDDLYGTDGEVNSVEATAPIARDNATGVVTISLTDGGISTGKIADDAVTEDKLANAINSAIAANTAKTGITSGQASAITANTAKVTNATHTNEVTGDVALTIANDVISYAKLAAEFTTSSPLTAATSRDMSFSAAQVFTMTSSIAVDINFTNAEIGQIKDLIVTDSGGTSSLTFDTSSNTITTIQGTYSATAGAVNFIQVVCTAANTFFLSISQSI